MQTWLDRLGFWS